MSWYYNSDSGKIQESSAGMAYLQLHGGLGWHGPFDTKDAALKYYTDNQAKNPGWKKPTESTAGATANALVNGNPITNAVTDALGGFNVGGWFIRVGEILLGLVLIGVGVAKLTGTANTISKVAKAAI